VRKLCLKHDIFRRHSASLLPEDGFAWYETYEIMQHCLLKYVLSWCSLAYIKLHSMKWRINACVVGLPSILNSVVTLDNVRHCWGTSSTLCGVAPIVHKTLGIDWWCNRNCSMKLLGNMARLIQQRWVIWFYGLIMAPHVVVFFSTNAFCMKCVAYFLCWLKSPVADEPISTIYSAVCMVEPYYLAPFKLHF
jgi:hypothetical protein